MKSIKDAIRGFGQILFWGGTSKEEFQMVQEEYVRMNSIILRYTSGSLSILFLALMGLSAALPLYAKGVLGYSALAFIMMLIFGVCIALKKKTPMLNDVLILLLCGSLYAYGTYTATIVDPSSLSVLFVVILALLPIIFYERPIASVSKQLIAVVIFVWMTIARSPAYIAFENILDVLIFGAVSFALNLLLATIKTKYCLSAAKDQEREKLLESALVSERTAKDELNITLEKVQERSDIMQSLARSYNCLYYIDLVQNTFVELYSDNREVTQLIGTSGKAREKLDVMCRYMIYPAYVSETTTFTNLFTLNDRLKGKSVISMRFEGVHLGWSEISFIPVDPDENGCCSHVLYTIRGIREEKEKEDREAAKLEEALALAESASREKSSFLFNLSHDLLTPLNSIMGFSELAGKKETEDAKRGEYLKGIRLASLQLLELINNVIENSRIENDVVFPEERPINPRRLFMKMEPEFREMGAERDQVVRLNTLGSASRCIYSDEELLRKIGRCILSIAFHFGFSGAPIRMDFSLDEGPDDVTGLLQLKVACAESESVMNLLGSNAADYEKYKKGESADLVLASAIVRGLLERMRGSCSVRFVNGESVITALVPVQYTSEEVAEAQVFSLEKNPDRFKGKRVLIAEDDILNAKIAEELLGYAGIETERAEDGVICVSMIENAPGGYYDAILMDIKMPNMDGFEATKLIRKLPEFKKSSIPIAAMTANAYEEDRKLSLDAGMDAHIVKPVELNSMLSTLDALIK